MTSPLFCCQSSFGHDSHWCLINVKNFFFNVFINFANLTPPPPPPLLFFSVTCAVNIVLLLHSDENTLTQGLLVGNILVVASIINSFLLCFCRIIILYDRGRIQRYFFTIWHRRGRYITCATTIIVPASCSLPLPVGNLRLS
jgi:hypothetical protein